MTDHAKLNSVDNIWNIQNDFTLAKLVIHDMTLTHRGGMTHKYVSKIDRRLFGWWIVASSATIHHLNQCWLIVNWNRGNKFQIFQCPWVHVCFTHIEYRILNQMRQLQENLRSSWQPFCLARNMSNVCFLISIFNVLVFNIDRQNVH